jgi:hypothetical protein
LPVVVLKRNVSITLKHIAMKKIIFTIVTASTLTISLHAKFTQMKPNTARVEALQTLMPINSSLPVDKKNLIKIKALRDFNKAFKTVTGEDWYVIQDGFMARFKQQDITYRVIYNKTGTWMATFRYYNEDQLPREVRDAVKSTWYDFTITSVTEVSYGAKTALLVNIENNTSLKTIKVAGGEMEVFQDICKN